MATTWTKAVHRTNSSSISAALKRTLDYTGNPDKTEGGELVAAFECDPMTAESEFLLAKKIYEQRTGRNQGRHDVIGYHVRQSFKPGEVTTEEALKIGYELALRWTRGRHQFVVAAHTNTNNPHTHIFFNSVTLDCSRKFEDFKRSAIALRRVSDHICLEHGLSIIEKPGLSKGQNRAEYLGDHKPPSNRQRLMALIDSNLSAGKTFDEFLAAMEAAGCEVKHGKHLAFLIPGAKKNIRLYSLGEDYSETAIRERLAGRRVVASGAKAYTPPKQNAPSLLVDIQAKIATGKGAGYEQWAKIFNLKQAAKTLIFLQENGIDSYDDLKEKSASASVEFAALTSKIKEVESRQKEVDELQKYIGQYGKTRDVYAQYKASGWSQNFYDAHAADIILHKAAKKHFDGLGLKKLPSINQLKQEWAALDAEKKKLYSGYRRIKDNSRALLTAKMNADCILGITPDGEIRGHVQEAKPHKNDLYH